MTARRGRAVTVAVAGLIFWSAAANGCDSAQQAAAPGPNACADLVVSHHPEAPPPTDPTRPVMGFDPYNTFGTTIDQGLIIAVVTAMAGNGMRAAGYRYVILDDGWQGDRTSDGQIAANSGRFPCGIQRLAAFVHAEGFRFGLYTSAAPQSCSGRVGSGGREAADARTFASWGVDYVKLDWCGADYSPSGADAIARTWRAALNATGRPIILAINAGGSPSVGAWAHLTADSWRVGGDICGSWYNQTRPPAATARRCYDRRYEEGIYDYLTSPGVQEQEKLAGPGHHIDPDMLEVGTAAESPSGKDLTTPALDAGEAATNFAIWGMWSAPLIAGNDPRSVTGADPAGEILLNRQIIAIDQDPLGRPAALVASSGNWQVWRKPLVNGSTAVAVVNLADSPQSASFSWARLAETRPPASVTDAWTHRAVPVTATGLHVQAVAHATAMYVLVSR